VPGAAFAAVGALDRHAAVVAVRPLDVHEHPGVGRCRVQHAAEDQDAAEDRALHVSVSIFAEYANMGRGQPNDRFEPADYKLDIKPKQKRRPGGRLVFMSQIVLLLA
jgi:hypothetical protein